MSAVVNGKPRIKKDKQVKTKKVAKQAGEISKRYHRFILLIPRALALMKKTIDIVVHNIISHNP